MPGQKSRGIQGKHGYQFHKFEEGASVGTFEDEEGIREDFFYPYLKGGMTVVDVGSAYGSYTLPALARGCKVIAINSPHECIEEIKGNVGLNPGFEERFQIYPYFAASKSVGKYRRIDSLLRNRKCDFLKIDVEGDELKVLNGARHLIIRNKPVILVENHLFKDKSLEEKCIKFIKSLKLGYKYKSRPYQQISHTLFTCC